MKKLLPFIFSIILPVAAQAISTPSSLKLTVHQIAVSLNADCSSPKVIFTSTNPAGTESDFLAAPTLGSGKLADGTYNCMMITMEDVIKFKIAVTDATCTAGLEYTIDVCRNTASSSIHESMTDILSGTTFTSTECAGTSQSVAGGGISNKATLYLRTNATITADADFTTAFRAGSTLADARGAGQPSVTSPNGLPLATAFIVNGAKTGTFYVDATNAVDGTGSCQMNPPVFGFR